MPSTSGRKPTHLLSALDRLMQSKKDKITLNKKPEVKIENNFKGVDFFPGKIAPVQIFDEYQPQERIQYTPPMQQDPLHDLLKWYRQQNLKGSWQQGVNTKVDDAPEPDVEPVVKPEELGKWGTKLDG